MARRPAPLELVGGKGPRQRLWDAIRARKGAEWTRYEISRAANVDDGTTSTYVQSLQAAGIVDSTREERKTNVAAVRYYKLLKDEGIDAPRVRRDGSRVAQGLPQEQMWRTLRSLKGDTNARELAAYASTDAIQVDEEAAGDYLKHLYAADYLVRTAEARRVGRSGKTQSRYRLLKNTGPRAPMICRTKVVYDPNLGKVVHQEGVTEEDAIYGR